MENQELKTEYLNENSLRKHDGNFIYPSDRIPMEKAEIAEQFVSAQFKFLTLKTEYDQLTEREKQLAAELKEVSARRNSVMSAIGNEQVWIQRLKNIS
jgi:hypothetical protein